jgi:hypothetical protein
MSAQNDEQQQPGMYLSLSNDTKLEAKLHVFNMSSFIGLDFREPGFSFEFGGGHTPLPLSCCTTLLIWDSDSHSFVLHAHCTHPKRLRTQYHAQGPHPGAPSHRAILPGHISSPRSQTQTPDSHTPAPPPPPTLKILQLKYCFPF